MAIDIKKLIAAISPDIYCESVPDFYGVSPRVEVKRMIIIILFTSTLGDTP
jgi:hypothetical protein